MKKLFLMSIVAACAVCLAGLGCSKKKVQADATAPLAESFATAEPEVQKAIEVVNTSLKAGNYVEATRALAPVVEQRVLTEPQKEAVGIALQQMNQAIAADPALDTKEMYEMRAKMFQATRRGSRF